MEKRYMVNKISFYGGKSKESLPISTMLLSLILYSDVINIDTLGKSQLHSIYVSIGNIKNWKHNKPDAKQLLGYFSILEASDNSEKQKDKFKNAARDSFHKSLELLLDPLLKLNNGINLTLNGNKIWFYSRVSVIIADWSEAATYCLTFKSAMSNFSCYSCLVTKNHLPNIDLQMDDITSRTHINMYQYYSQGLEKSVCIENVPNYFWELP